jgi:ribosomal protein L29
MGIVHNSTIEHQAPSSGIEFESSQDYTGTLHDEEMGEAEAAVAFEVQLAQKNSEIATLNARLASVEASIASKELDNVKEVAGLKKELAKVNMALRQERAAKEAEQAKRAQAKELLA